MKRFHYVCADPGVPVPGTKGASIHVASVCRALTQVGLDGEVHALRPLARRLGELPVRRIRSRHESHRAATPRRESDLFLAGLGGALPRGGPRPDFIYERYSLWHAGGLARARRLGVPFVLEVNSPLPEEARRYRSLSHGRLADGVAELLLRGADGVVCVSEEVAQWVGRIRDSSDHVWLVPNGVDAELFAPGPKSRPAGLPPAVPLVAFCGSFRPWHGLGDLLEAMVRLEAEDRGSVHLLCIGDGPLRETFERRAAELGLSGRVILTGALPHHEVPRWLAAADVAVAPYARSDGFYFSPLKIFEFLALGLPVVAANVGQVARIVEHGERGLLYPPGDAGTLARRIARLLDDPAAAAELGRRGRQWVLEHATWQKRIGLVLERLEAL